MNDTYRLYYVYLISLLSIVWKYKDINYRCTVFKITITLIHSSCNFQICLRKTNEMIKLPAVESCLYARLNFKM